MLLILALIAVTFSALALWSDGALRTLFTAIIIAANLGAFLLDILRHKASPANPKSMKGHSGPSDS